MQKKLFSNFQYHSFKNNIIFFKKIKKIIINNIIKILILKSNINNNL